MSAKTRAAILVAKTSSLIRDLKNGSISEDEFVRDYAKALAAMPEALEALLNGMDRPKIQAPVELTYKTKTCPRCGGILHLTGTWSRTPSWRHDPELDGCGYAEIASSSDVLDFNFADGYRTKSTT